MIGSSSQYISTLIQDLHHTFSYKDLGPLHYFLGIETNPTTHGLLLTQTKYTHDLLTPTRLEHFKPTHTPITPTLPLSKDHDTPFSNPYEYCSTVGALQHLCPTRPDIQFLGNKVSQFLHCLTDVHWTVIKRILLHLCATQNMVFISLGSLTSPSTPILMLARSDVLMIVTPPLAIISF